MKKSLSFWLCLFVALTLFIAGFLVPPMGVIDPSVLTAGGILFLFATLSQLPSILEVAGKAKLSYGNATIEVEKKEA